MSPAYFQLEVNAGESEVRDEIDVRNASDAGVFVRLSAVDPDSFPGLGQIFGIESDTLGDRLYDVSKVRLASSGEWIAAGESKKIPFMILSDDTLMSGGNYGVFLVEWDGGETERGAIGIGQTIAIPVLLANTDGADAQIRLERLGYRREGADVPVSAFAHIRNFGNSHSTPRGLLTVSDPFGREVARGTLNEDSAIVLPGSAREYAIGLQSIQSSRIPGMYTLMLKYRVDGSDAFTTYQRKAFVFPTTTLIWTVSVVAVLCILLFFVVRLRRKRQTSEHPEKKG